MNLHLSVSERIALLELLTEAVYGTNYALAPRPRQFTSLLLKLRPSAPPPSDNDLSRLLAVR
jgi:hypothetical protein